MTINNLKVIILLNKELHLYEINFYKDRKGKEEVLDYIRELSSKKDKDSRIKSNKINDYLELLSIHGTTIGEPYVKHIEGEIWELRPLRDRIFFVSWQNNTFVLLHHFMKKTQKTPKKEIDAAKRKLQDLKERRDENE